MLSPFHMWIIVCVGVPGMIIYILLLPDDFKDAVQRQGTLSSQAHTIPGTWMGFVFAGYRLGYEWWEAVVRLQGAVLLSIFLGHTGCLLRWWRPMVLIAALSMHLQHRPYQDEAHNYQKVWGCMSACCSFW